VAAQKREGKGKGGREDEGVVARKKEGGMDGRA
jgi:hypothetical protein